MRRLIAALAMAVIGLYPVAAFAHPHIFIDAKATITFNDQGEVASIHNAWTFDAAYSAWSVQGLDTNNDGKLSKAELQPLAADNMDGLASYEYYTFAGEGNDPNLKFGHGQNAVLDYVDGQSTLNFDVPLAKPYPIRKALELSIDDPEYYVAITFKDANAVKLVNAPKNCAVVMEDPKQMPDELADALYALPPDVTKLPPNLEQAMRGMQGAILINCPGGSASTAAGRADMTAPVAAPVAANALDAVNQMGDAQPDQPAAAASDETTAQTASDAAASDQPNRDKPAADQAAADAVSASSASVPVTTGMPPIFAGNIPFGAAPNEPGLNLPRTGFLGWVQQKQVDFYLALTKSLAALKTDWTAFWVLGLLSFLYGVFHAAGPGHGKVVISSYVLANEAQVKRGILLSFISAMIQSLVAIAFVLVAATVLGMTAMAMSEAANWIGIISYAMIALLGLWLFFRKIFGWGHKHDHGHDHAHEQRPGRRPARSDKLNLARQHMGAPAHALATGGPSLTSFRVSQSGPDAFGRLPGEAHYGHSHGDEDEHDDEHVHAITPAQFRGTFREQAGVVLAVGMRPCSGALIVLAFALSQGLLVAGIIAVLLMGVGTAITTGALATMAVGFKGLARGIAGADNKITATLVWWAELLAAAGVFAFGVVLVLASL